MIYTQSYRNSIVYHAILFQEPDLVVGRRSSHSSLVMFGQMEVLSDCLFRNVFLHALIFLYIIILFLNIFRYKKFLNPWIKHTCCTRNSLLK
ncbi:hypothetical protein GDO81_018313 [Engystomops pustulosus]|uniref:Uncharacterized protein n=1 Tax=Engystomops pustulosus TaxID=76066 RepID=A0AAV7AAY1_ENGPU|nr:hypothetical protein GDO81_018313 [Engystomops pustulosus]